MGRFQLGNPGGPGRPPLDARVRRAREIISERLIPALPGIVDRLLASRQPRILLDTLRLLLPFVETQASAEVDSKFQQREGLVERTLRELWSKQQDPVPVPASLSQAQTELGSPETR